MKPTNPPPESDDTAEQALADVEEALSILDELEGALQRAAEARAQATLGLN
jgi:hypothetical protein